MRDVSYLPEGGGQSSYLFVNANFGFGKFTTHAIIAIKEISDDQLDASCILRSLKSDQEFPIK